MTVVLYFILLQKYSKYAILWVGSAPLSEMTYNETSHQCYNKMTLNETSLFEDLSYRVYLKIHMLSKLTVI